MAAQAYAQIAAGGNGLSFGFTAGLVQPGQENASYLIGGFNISGGNLRSGVIAPDSVVITEDFVLGAGVALLRHRGVEKSVRVEFSAVSATKFVRKGGTPSGQATLRILDIDSGELLQEWKGATYMTTLSIPDLEEPGV